MDIFSNLEGKFRGSGSGSYPTIQPFTFGEEVGFESLWQKKLQRSLVQVEFRRLGNKTQPAVFSYSQRTWNLATNTPMHAENGFLRVFDDRAIELIVAAPTGLAEIEHGRSYVNEEGLV